MYTAKDLEFTHRWYNGNIPKFNSNGFWGVIGRQLVRDELDNNKFVISFENIATASYHYDNKIDKGVISISFGVFSEDWYKAISGIDVDKKDLNIVALSVINAFLVHEARHYATFDNINLEVVRDRFFKILEESDSVKNLPEDKKDFFKSTIGKFNESAFGSAAYVVYNLVEDLFIESLNTNHSDAFLHIANKFLFNDKKIQERTNNFQAKRNINNYVDLLIGYKRYDVRDALNELISNEVIDILNKITTNTSIQERMQIASDLFIQIFLESGFDEQEKDDMCKQGQNNSQESAGNKCKGLSSQQESDLSEISEDYIDNLSDNEWSALSDELEKVNLDIKEFKASNLKGFEIVNLHKNEQYASYEMKYRTDFRSLAQMIQAKTDSEPDDKDIVSSGEFYDEFAYRWSMDKKIFSIDENTGKSSDDYQIVFLIDCSGSTNWTLVDKEPLWKFASRRIMYVAKELVGARVEHAVCCYTSEEEHDAYPKLFIVHDFRFLNQKVQFDIDKNFGRIHSIPKGYNVDHLGIQYVSRFFKPDKTKIIVVLSDGLPNDYDGENGGDLLRKTIKDLRKRGFNIISFCLTEDVKSANIELYGEEWTFDVTTPNKFKKSIYNILNKII